MESSGACCDGAWGDKRFGVLYSRRESCSKVPCLRHINSSLASGSPVFSRQAIGRRAPQIRSVKEISSRLGLRRGDVRRVYRLFLEPCRAEFRPECPQTRFPRGARDAGRPPRDDRGGKAVMYIQSEPRARGEEIGGSPRRRRKSEQAINSRSTVATAAGRIPEKWRRSSKLAGSLRVVSGGDEVVPRPGLEPGTN